MVYPGSPLAESFSPDRPVPQPELGLVCITASNQVRYRTITRKRLLQMAIPEQEQALRELYAENLRRLDKALDFCVAQGIHLYRVASGLFPFADEPIGAAILSEFDETLKQVGDRAQQLGIRIVMHPEQYVVLNSDNPEVIRNSIKILTTYATTFDKLGLPRSPWALMNIHGGKGDRSERLIQVIRDLPDPIRNRLTLENDEYTYGSDAILDICQATGVPMVFDAHHHAVHDHLTSYDDASVGKILAQARTTWAHPDWQVVHISNGSEFFNDPRHSDLITVMPVAFRQAPWIEVEAKQKELAIAKLREDWLNPSSGCGPERVSLESEISSFSQSVSVL